MDHPIDALARSLSRLTIAQLKPLLRLLRRPVYGSKQDLLERLAAAVYVETAENVNEVIKHVEPLLHSFYVDTIKQRIQDLRRNAPDGVPGASVGPIAQDQTSSSRWPAQPPHRQLAQHRPQLTRPNQADFERFPFWEIVEPLGELSYTEPGTTAYIPFQLSVAQHNLVFNEATRESGGMHRVMMYSAAAARIRQVTLGPAPVDLPRPSKIRLFNKEMTISQLARGKPTFQYPIDLSKLTDTFPIATRIHLHISQQHVHFDDAFGVRVYLVRLRPIEAVAQLVHQGVNLDANAQARLKCPRSTKRVEGEDVMALATEMPLSCPIGLTRIVDPAKGVYCSHQQCFDLTNFLAMNARAPAWTCPICNKPLPFHELTVDAELAHILKQLPADVTSITIEADGSFRNVGTGPPRTPNLPKDSTIIRDIDLNHRSSHAAADASATAVISLDSEDDDFAGAGDENGDEDIFTDAEDSAASSMTSTTEEDGNIRDVGFFDEGDAEGDSLPHKRQRTLHDFDDLHSAFTDEVLSSIPMPEPQDLPQESRAAASSTTAYPLHVHISIPKTNLPLNGSSVIELD